MGYYTQYNLDVVDPADIDRHPELEQVGLVACKSFDAYGLMDDGSCSDEVKWYDHDKNMRAMSRAYPDVLFRLEGNGEEQGDVWMKYYKGGKCQRLEPTILWPDFDPSQMN